MTLARTEAGREAVRFRGLFGGETEERASEWVRKIEEEARAEGYSEGYDAGYSEGWEYADASRGD